MKFSILTLFPELIEPWISGSLLGKAEKRNILEFESIDLRHFSNNKHHKVDEPPYGGGAGMVIRVDVVARALEDLTQRSGTPDEIILLTPAGKTWTQPCAEHLSKANHIALLCGRYEGFDARVETLVTREISIGDFVMMGGEAAALCLIESIGRLVEGALGDADSHRQDSFSSGLLDYGEYTRPPEWNGHTVPEILRSGNHAAIDAWRRRDALRRTFERRPDLIPGAQLQPKDSAMLIELGATEHQMTEWALPNPPKPKRKKR